MISKLAHPLRNFQLLFLWVFAVTGRMCMCVNHLGLLLYSTGPWLQLTIFNFWPKGKEATASSASMLVVPMLAS